MAPLDITPFGECPSEAELIALDRGQLPDRASLRVHAHLDHGCARCAALRERLSGSARTLPATVGRYRILAEVGRGGMGVVYRARDPESGRTVAVKCLVSGLALDSLGRQRFRQEVQALARVEHANVVRLQDFDVDGHPPYLVMEFVDGSSLAQVADRRLLPFREVARLMAQVADAVQAVHDRGLLHRDLKPANVLLTTAGEPKVSDFGLAAAVDESDDRHIHHGAILGTPQYMAPEQARGEGVTTATDVYGLGATLYHLLAGQPPFQGSTVNVVIDQVLTTVPIPPTCLQPGVPRDLAAICLKCLQKESSRRYPRAADLAADLRRWLAGQPVQARRLRRGNGSECYRS